MFGAKYWPKAIPFLSETSTAPYRGLLLSPIRRTLTDSNNSAWFPLTTMPSMWVMVMSLNAPCDGLDQEKLSTDTTATSSSSREKTYRVSRLMLNRFGTGTTQSSLTINLWLQTSKLSNHLHHQYH